MTDNLRTRIAAALKTDIRDQAYTLVLLEEEEPYSVLIDGTVNLLEVADAVIRELPELGRIAKVTEVCIASLDLDSRVGTALSDRQWLAETILNVLNGAVDD